MSLSFLLFYSIIVLMLHALNQEILSSVNKTPEHVQIAALAVADVLDAADAMMAVPMAAMPTAVLAAVANAVITALAVVDALVPAVVAAKVVALQAAIAVLQRVPDIV